MKKAVVLLSGGLDSTTCVAIARSLGFEVHALSFDYGQRQSIELDAAKRIAAHYGIAHRIIHLKDIGQLGGSALTDLTMAVPDYTGADKIPATYVPARNTVFLSIALGFAEVLGARDIFLGISHVDYSGYPDCRPEYLAAFQAMANLANRCGVEGDPIRIHAPLIHLSKAETIQKGLCLGVDYSLTVTCYQATATRLACGHCDSCVLRQRGFVAAGFSDPLML